MEKKVFSRRDFLRLTGLSAAGAAFVACTPQQAANGPVQSNPDEQPTTAGAPTEAITLRMWHWDNFLGEGYKPIVAKFTEKNPNIQVAIEMTNWGEFSQKVAASVAGNTPPDIVGTVSEHFTNMAGQEQLIDLQSYIDAGKLDLNDYHPGNLAQNSWGGKIRAIPYTADCYWIFFNVDLFKQKGVKTPYEYWKEGNWTWETAAEVAQQMTSGEGMDKYFGWGGVGYADSFQVFSYLASHDTDLFDSGYTKAQLTDPKVQDFYTWAYDLRPYAPGPDDQEMGTPKSGRVAMWHDWSPFGQVNKADTPFEYSYAPPPASPVTKKVVYCGDACGFGILKGVKHPDQSWALIEHLNIPEYQEMLFNLCGQEPPRISVATDAAVWERNTNFPHSKEAHELTVDRLKGYFCNWPKISNLAEMTTALGEELSLAWVDDQPLLQALTTANDRITELLQAAAIDRDRTLWQGS